MGLLRLYHYLKGVLAWKSIWVAAQLRWLGLVAILDESLIHNSCSRSKRLVACWKYVVYIRSYVYLCSGHLWRLAENIHYILPTWLNWRLWHGKKLICSLLIHLNYSSSIELFEVKSCFLSSGLNIITANRAGVTFACKVHQVNIISIHLQFLLPHLCSGL